MPTEVFVIIIFLLLFVFYFLISRKLKSLEQQKPSEELLEIVRMLQTGSKEDRRMLLESLQRNTQSLNERLDSATRVIGAVQKNIGEMSEIGRSMKDLQEFLRSPKLRGNIGEHILAELLGQMLPKQSFHLQYSFRSGQKVDAAIKTAAGIVPIDSKFPMESFRKLNSARNDEEKHIAEKQLVKDVKNHIDDISSKYILTDEGTIDYALMYVPSESVYYEIVNNPGLFEYASQKRILPVSPTTFYAYLRAILMSFEGQKIESQAKDLISSLRAIQKDYQKVEENLSTLEKHIGNANNMMNLTHTTFLQLGQKIRLTQNIGEAVTPKKSLKEK
jgi:DNA recombination protein RmuC